MAKGYQKNREWIEAIGSFGKSIGKRADNRCEWCESMDDLRRTITEKQQQLM